MISPDHAQPPYIAVRVHRIWKIRVQILALRLRSFLFLLGYLPLCFEGQREATSANLALVRYWLADTKNYRASEYVAVAGLGATLRGPYSECTDSVVLEQTGGTTYRTVAS